MTDWVLEAIRLSLRISTQAFDDELDSLIDAALAELRIAGIRETRKNCSPVALNAVRLYCKAYFGSDGQNQKYLEMFDKMKHSMELDDRYTGRRELPDGT